MFYNSEEEMVDGKDVVVVNGDRDVLVVGTSHGSLLLLDPQTGEGIEQIQAHNEVVSAICSGKRRGEGRGSELFWSGSAGDLAGWLSRSYYDLLPQQGRGSPGEHKQETRKRTHTVK